MTIPLQPPLQIDRVQSVRVDVDRVQLSLSGRWVDPSGAGEEELLVVQVDGRRHRFTASRQPAEGEAEGWGASFTLPSWAEPRYDGQAALWLGSSVIPVAVPQSAEGAVAAPARERGRPATGSSAAADPPRSGPLADLLLKETVAALQAELEQRTAEAAQTRGELADAKSELEARAAIQATLEVTQAQLRAELERLMTAVERQRAEQEGRQAEAGSVEVVALREQVAAAEAAAGRRAAEAAQTRAELAAANVARDAAVSEVGALRAELERLGTELAATRERVDAEGGDLGEAQRLLADAKALAEQLRVGDAGVGG